MARQIKVRVTMEEAANGLPEKRLWFLLRGKGLQFNGYPCRTNFIGSLQKYIDPFSGDTIYKQILVPTYNPEDDDNSTCFDVGDAGGCGLECPVLKRGDCTDAEDMLKEVDPTDGDYKDLYETYPDVLERRIKMNQENIILSQNPDFKFVTVTFETKQVNIDDLLKGKLFKPEASKTYVYKTLDDIKLGETVLVIAPEGIKAVVVVGFPKLTNVSTSMQYKWIYSRLGENKYEEGMEMEERVREILHDSAVEKLRKELLDNIPRVTQTKLRNLVLKK